MRIENAGAESWKTSLWGDWAERSEKDMMLNWIESWRKSIVSRTNSKCKAFAWCHQTIVEMSDWSLMNRGRQVTDEVRSGRAFCYDKHFCISLCSTYHHLTLYYMYLSVGLYSISSQQKKGLYLSEAETSTACQLVTPAKSWSICLTVKNTTSHGTTSKTWLLHGVLNGAGSLLNFFRLHYYCCSLMG